MVSSTFERFGVSKGRTQRFAERDKISQKP
jgi:hypothetical protein